MPDLDLTALERWLADRVAPPLRATRVPHGHSNLTYLLDDDAGRRLVLRRPPLGHVLATAHDVLREARVVTALAGTAVPVPPVLATDGGAVLDAPCYVMAFVDGVVLRDAATAATLAPAARAAASESLVDALVALHAIDPADVGLADLGRADGYVARQLRRWLRQIDEGGARNRARLADLHDRLAASVPAGEPGRIVHGDYKLENVIVSTAGDVRAVLDWELATLGDPLADLGALLVYWDAHVDGRLPVVAGPGAAGFPSARSLADRYARRSGRDLADLGFYVAFAAWRLACILEGVHARYVDDSMGRPLPPELAGFDDQIAALADRAETALTTRRRG